jgi:two-component system sensor histidine kinase/response regulator
MTANAMAGDRERSLATGMNDHVTKPIDPDALFEALLRWLPPDRVTGVQQGASPASVPEASRVGQGVSPAGTPGAADPLFAVAGLDAADGLRRVLGKREAYVRLLDTFASSQARVPDEIRAAMAEGRRADAERAAHTLKGVAGSIGARQLQAEAAVLEAALRERADDSTVAVRLEPLETSLRTLVASLAPALPVQEAPPVATAAADPEAVRAAVGRIQQLLEQDDAKAVAAIDEASPILRAALGDRVDAIRKHAKGYRFDDALGELRAAAAAAGLS